MSENNIEFGLSVRPPLLMMRQDEVIIKQYIMSLMEWRGRKGETPQKPKDEGQGVMCSGVNCRELGYGKQLTAEELEQVNLF